LRFLPESQLSVYILQMASFATERSAGDLAFSRLRVLFDSHGDSNYIGEPVSIIQHSLQAAHFTKKRCPGESQSEIELVIGSLLHDIGHVLGLEMKQPMEMNGCGVKDHELVGGEFLQKLDFNDRVCNLARSHVQAKRYLTFSKPDYYSGLSEASKTTLGFQGGPMDAAQASAFENDPDFRNYLMMRECDEAGKVPGNQLQVPPLEHYKAYIDACIRADFTPRTGGYTLSDFQLKSFQQNSFLKIENLLNFDGLNADMISEWVNEVASWPKAENKWLLHWEENPVNGEKMMCRGENFVNYHKGFEHLTRRCVQSIVSQLFGESANLFKEKINFKLVGGAGFAAHQDSPAYIGLASDHISVMVAADAATTQNGCLQVCPGQWSQASNVPLTSDGIIRPEAEKEMTFQPVLCKPGDVLFFSGYLPHRSEQNKSDSNRRAIFLTYNPASQGDHHEAYYAAKHANVHGFDSSQTISFQGDFQGKIVE